MYNNEMMYDDMSMKKFPANTPLAMSYVPWQKFGDTYSENEALEKATLFKDLYFPFEGGEVAYNG